MRRYWYWPGWKGGNTKNKAGKGDKVLVLGDYLGSQKVGEGGELCVLVSQKGEGDITSAKGGRRLADCLIS